MAGNSSRRRFLSQGGRWLALASAGPALGSWWLGCTRPEQNRGRRFGALGTQVTVVVRGAEERRAESAIRAATREIFAIHEAFTLFEPSPLVTLNQQARGRRVSLDDELFVAVQQAAQLWRETAGHYDPGLGLWTGPGQTATGQTLPEQGFAAAELDLNARSLRLESGEVALDLNGFAKGLAVDRAVASLRQHGLQHFVVNAGGDLYAAGDASAAEHGWQIRVHDGVRAPGDRASADRATLRLRDRAAATSGQASPAWRSHAHRQEHLLEPRSGRPASQLRTATVLAPRAALADAWATALFVAPRIQHRALLTSQPELGALLLAHGGELQRFGLST